MEKLKNPRREKQINAYYKFFLCFLMLNLIGISLISAANWDNVKTYNPETKTATIINAFGLGEDIATITLNSPSNNYVIRGKDRLVAEFTINSFDDYENVFNKMEFYDLNKGGRKFERDFNYKYRTYKLIDIDEFETTCEERQVINASAKTGFSTEYYNCVQSKTGSRTVKNYSNWLSFDDEVLLPKGEKILGIFTDVEQGDYVEWIPTLFGERNEEWAIWNSSFNTKLEMYYKLSNKSNAVNNGEFNLSEIGTVVYSTDGKNNKCANVTNGVNLNTTTSSAVYNPVQNNSINMWIRPASLEKLTNKSYIFYGIFGGDQQFLSFNQSGDITISDAMLEDLVWYSSGQEFQINTWTMITLVSNDTSLILYINGTQIHQGRNGTAANGAGYLNIGHRTGQNDDLNGSIDEIGVWNRTLSASEVSDLWNDGTGIFYSALATATITLNAPDDNYVTVNQTITFNCTGEDDVEVKNISLYLNGERNTTQAGDGSNDLELYETLRIGFGKHQNWTCLVVDDINLAAWATNRTFNISEWSEISQTYNENATEGNIEKFEINISYDTIAFTNVEGNLYYNNTKYVGDKTTLDLYTNFSVSVEVPTVTTKTNITFWWDIVLINASSNHFNSTVYNQSVANIGADACSTFTTRIINATLRDEESQALIEVNDSNSSIEIDVDIFTQGGDTPVIEFSQNFSENVTANICINDPLNSSTYEMDVQIRYDGDDYASEFYYIQNTTLTNSTIPINITLFDLLDASAQEFKITYKDENFLGVADALVQIQRKYISDGVFKTVEQPKTDTNGETMAQLQLTEAVYTIVITKYGVTLATFSDIIAVCQNPTLETCEINLNSFASALSTTDFTVGDDFAFTLTFNSTSREIESIYSIPSGTASEVMLNATLFDSLGVTQACADTITSSSGTLACVVPLSVGNGSVIAKVSKAGTVVGEAFISLKQEPEDLYETNLVFLGLFLMLMLIGVGLSDSPALTGIFVFIGAVLLIVFNLIDTSTSAFYGVGATILWLAIAIIIIAIKERT